MRIRSMLTAPTALTAIVASALALSGCSAPPGAEDSSGAGANGSLTVACSQQEDFCQAITAAYEKKTGSPVTYVRLGAGEVLARLETNPGEFDIWMGGQAENHLVASDKGWIEDYISPNASALPAEYNDEKGTWSGFYTDSIAFCSNQDELDRLGVKAPQSFEDLLDPGLRGHIAMPHPATAGVGYMAMYTVAQLHNGDQTATIDYFKQLNGSIMQYSKSAATGTEQAGRGETAVAIALDSDCQKAIDAGYSSLTLSYPQEGTGYEVGAVSVLANARNGEGAKAMMDWLLSTEAQDLYADVPSYAAPTLPDAKIGESVPKQDGVKHVTWDNRDAADSRTEYIDAFEEQVAGSSEAK